MKIEKQQEVIYRVGNKKFFDEDAATYYVENFSKLTKGRRLYNVSVVTDETISLHEFGKFFVASVPSKSPDELSLWQYLGDMYGSPVVTPMRGVHIPRYEIYRYASVTLENIMDERRDVVFIQSSGEVDEALTELYERLRGDE